ncbi:hypothetical protein HWV62_5698, partial [Athelia sp. TMB]
AQREQQEAALHLQETNARQQQDISKQAQRDQAQDAAKIRQEEIMRKRAEQSARDKARNQQLREERAQAKALESAGRSPSTAPPNTPIEPPTSKAKRTRVKRVKGGTLVHRSYTTADLFELSAPEPAPITPERKQEYTRHAPPSPPMTPEDFQSMPIPTDLFMYEPPTTPAPPPAKAIATETLPPTPASSSASLRTPADAPRVRGRGRGRGAMRSASIPYSPPDVNSEANRSKSATVCRYFNMPKGCARGDSCSFAHISTGISKSRAPRAAALEEELARKNLELERMRAEPAKANLSA